MTSTAFISHNWGILWSGIVFIMLISNAHTASALSSPDIKGEINDILLPNPNATGGPVAEIQCYALPYGAIGMISHLLTYWTIAWMAVGMIPLWPFHRMTSYKFDMALAIIALCTCVPIASIAIHRCRLSWHFVLIAIWKLVTSVSLACITIHRCLITRLEVKQTGKASTSHTQYLYSSYLPSGPSLQSNTMYHLGNNASFFTDVPCSTIHPHQRNLKPLWWLIFYLLGTIIGMIGLLALVYSSFRHNDLIRKLTYGFAAPMAIIPILVAIYWFKKHLDLPNRGGATLWSAYLHTVGGALVAFIVVFGFFAGLYSDLVLGAIANNLFGLPGEDFAPLYWAWFIAKRLPLLSF